MRVASIIGSVVLTMAGCTSAPELPPAPWERPVEVPHRVPADRTRLTAELKRQHARWHALRPFRYQLKVTKLSFGDNGAPWLSQIEGRAVIGSSGGHFFDGRNVEPPLRTVEQLFFEAERAVKSDDEEVAVEFDERLGYPKRILIDAWRGSADDEVEFSAELKALP